MKDRKIWWSIEGRFVVVGCWFYFAKSANCVSGAQIERAEKHETRLAVSYFSQDFENRDFERVTEAGCEQRARCCEVGLSQRREFFTVLSLSEPRGCVPEMGTSRGELMRGHPTP